VALVGAFLRMTPFAAAAGLDRSDLLDAVGARLRRFYGKRGDDVMAANLDMVTAAYDGLIDVSGFAGPVDAAHALTLAPVTRDLVEVGR
jgi:hypothetical protein